MEAQEEEQVTLGEENYPMYKEVSHYVERKIEEVFLKILFATGKWKGVMIHADKKGKLGPWFSLRRLHIEPQDQEVAIMFDGEPAWTISKNEEQMTPTERRAKFVYDAARRAAQAAEAPIVPVPWDEREEPFKAQFLEVIERQCGEQRSKSPEELHGSWMQSYFAMGWVYGEKYDREAKIHPDLVPYADLGQLERDKDSVFVTLCEIARQWVY
jgi:hypothetical protein